MKPIIINLNFLGPETPSPKTLSEILQSVSQTTTGSPGTGEHQLSWLNSLNEEQLHFLSVFVHCEGKIKDVEKALGVSYPTVKSKLLELKQSMKIDAKDRSSLRNDDHSLTAPSSTLDILELLSNGHIDVNEAINLFKKTNGGDSQ